MKSQEIAKLAGVSRSTVSRVLNRYANVPQTTYDKVMKVIEQYDYVPNLSAQVLAGKNANAIGLFVADTSNSNRTTRIYSSSYFGRFVDAVVERANYDDYCVLINTIFNENEFVKIKQAYLQKRIDSVILAGVQHNSKHILELIDLNIPLAVISFDHSYIPKLSETSRLVLINTTDYQGACDATQYLIDLGHRSIGMIKGNMKTFSARERWRAFQDTMSKSKLSILQDFILEGSYSGQIAAEAVKAMIQKGNLPTALFCANDDMAIGVIKTFMELGYSVPEDISIIGFDDINIAQYITPALTTIKTSICKMAVEAVNCVESMAAGKSFSTKIINVPTELVIRASCKRID